MRNVSSIVLFTFLVNIASCQNASTQQQNQVNAVNAIKRTVTVEEFEQKLSSSGGAQLIDVRTPEEYAGGHLKNAVNINVKGDDFAVQAGKLNKTKPVMVYCKAGSRSAAAATKLQEMGFTEIYDMEGGIMKWEAAGKPVEPGNAVAGTKGITIDSLSKLVVGSKYVLVDYNAKWCEPCRKMLPYLESLAESRKDKMSLVKLDADENKELLKQKGVSGIPYLELYSNGKLVWTHSGFIEEAQLLKETKL